MARSHVFGGGKHLALQHPKQPRCSPLLRICVQGVMKSRMSPHPPLNKHINSSSAGGPKQVEWPRLKNNNNECMKNNNKSAAE